MSKKKFEVHYYCDDSGDHTAPIEECMKSNKKEFTDKDEMQNFVDECTHVTNLDELFDVVPKGEVKGLNKEIFLGLDEF